MPVVKIYGWPTDDGWLSKDDELSIREGLKRDVSEVIGGVEELGITSDMVTVFIIEDMSPQEENGDIIVDIFLYRGERRTPEVLKRMAECVGRRILQSFDDRSDKLVEVFPILYDPVENGAWTSSN